MVFNATFDNISVISWRSVLSMEETGVPGENRISWRSVLLVKETGGPGENHRPATSH